MKKKQLRAVLDWYMCSDPWPVDDNGGHDVVTDWLNHECGLHGFDDWVDAYHWLALDGKEQGE